MNKLPILQKGVSGGISFSGEKKISSRYLLYIFIFFVLIFFSFLVLKLFQLTIVKGDYYRRLSEQNRIRELIVEPKRGTIIDRNGLVIAENTQADISKISDRLVSHRKYYNSESAAQLVGYIQRADENDLKNDPCLYKLKIGDKVGKKGAEKIFECDLRGRQGKKLIEVDSKGEYVRTLSLLPPQDGKTIQLSLNMTLQKKVSDILKGKKAAVVATDPQTGEVILFVSTPSFNPEDFENENSKQIQSYLDDNNKPLFDRVAEATYPPGSIFKLVLAAGALEDKKIDDKTEFQDTGILHAGPLTFGNWYYLQYGKTDGMVNIVKAIQRSNDIFFYKTGSLLSPNRIKYWAEQLGYGKNTNIGLEESEGLIPSEFWKQDTIKEQWYLGDTYNLSIGQGFVLVTPLQVTQATSVFANGGYLCTPQLLKNNDPGSQLAERNHNCKKLPLSKKTIDLIREGMKEACSTDGTGWPLFDFKPQTACKTGTAESQGKNIQPHAWITVFAPYEKPEIVLTVLVEEGGQGSDVAGPIAKEILKAYFEKKD